MVEWYYKRDDTVFGPIAPEHLRELIQRGRLKDSTLLRAGEDGPWLTLAEAAEALPQLPDPATAVAEPAPPAPQSQEDYIVYSPPQSTPPAPEPGPPLLLRIAVFLTVTILAGMIVLWVARLFVLSSHIIHPDTWPDWLYAFGTSTAEFLQDFPQLLMIFFELMTLAMWQACAFASIRDLYADGIMYRSTASGLWWCVPVANFVMPVICLSELRHLCRKRRTNPQRGLPLGRLLWALEGVILGGVSLSLLQVGVGLAVKTGALQRTEMPWFNVLVALLGISSCVILIMVVVSNFRQQVRLYHHWHSEEFWLLQ